MVKFALQEPIMACTDPESVIRSGSTLTVFIGVSVCVCVGGGGGGVKWRFSGGAMMAQNLTLAS